MLIILSGTSSSGKTSLARAMLDVSERPLLHLEADRFWPELRPGHPATQEPEFRERMVVAMHEAIATFGRSGLDIIVDGSLPTEPDLRDRCLTILREAPDTRVVAVRSSLATLREREETRPDRPTGWAEESAKVIYEGVEFDATVDTTSGSPEEHARELLRSLFPA